jgi:hypothetical protein
MKNKIGVEIIILVGIIAGVVVLASVRPWHMDKKEAATQKDPEEEQKAREKRKAAEERGAAELLSTAKLHIESNNKATAKIILIEIMRHQPDTKAAEEARTLLASLDD